MVLTRRHSFTYRSHVPRVDHAPSPSVLLTSPILRSEDHVTSGLDRGASINATMIRLAITEVARYGLLENRSAFNTS